MSTLSDLQRIAESTRNISSQAIEILKQKPIDKHHQELLLDAAYDILELLEGPEYDDMQQDVFEFHTSIIDMIEGVIDALDRTFE